VRLPPIPIFEDASYPRQFWTNCWLGTYSTASLNGIIKEIIPARIYKGYFDEMYRMF
jgi:hypothetical protein